MQNLYENLFGFVSVAERMGNPVGYKGLLHSSQDLNSITDGIYCAMNTPNPINSPDAYNYLLVQLNHERLPDRKFQILFDGNSSAVWFRSKSTDWNRWSKVPFG